VACNSLLRAGMTKKHVVFTTVALLMLGICGTAWAYIERSVRMNPARVVNGTALVGCATRIQGFSHGGANSPGHFEFHLQTWDPTCSFPSGADSVSGTSHVAFLKWNAALEKAEICHEETFNTGGFKKESVSWIRDYSAPLCGQGWYMIASCSESLWFKQVSTTGGLSTVGKTVDDCASPWTWLYSSGGWHPWCSGAGCGTPPP
jgi:hypothetical protein